MNILIQTRFRHTQRLLFIMLVSSFCLRAACGAQETPNLKALQAKADQGDAEALFEMGRCYGKGLGIPKDEKKAYELYRQAADKGFPRAFDALGVMSMAGRGVVQDDKKALEYFLKGAHAGFAQAQYNLAWLIERGRAGAVDPTESLLWYEKAAGQGFLPAQKKLGDYYYFGSDRNDPELGKATPWIKQAAEAGDPWAQNLYGVMHENGHGVAADLLKAISWYEKAAEQGDVTAQKNLIEALEKKREDKSSSIKALAWACYRAGLGEQEFKDRVEAISKMLTPEERSQAQEAADEMKQRWDAKKNPAVGLKTN